MGGREGDIEIHANEDKTKLQRLFNSLRAEVTDNWNQRQEYTLVFVYYAGHGVMDNMTFALCNGFKLKDGSNGKASQTRFNLEN